MITLYLNQSIKQEKLIQQFCMFPLPRVSQKMGSFLFIMAVLLNAGVNVLKSNSEISAVFSKRRFNRMHGETVVESKTKFCNYLLWCISYLNSMGYSLVFGFNVSKPHQEKVWLSFNTSVTVEIVYNSYSEILLCE